jgi:thiomorpholine-carboxylate dehydrogenase
MDELIPLMRQVLIDFSGGRITQPARRMLPVPSYDGFLGSMPAASANALGAKLVTFYPGNAKKNIHTHMAVIALFEPETGEPLAVLDGRLITEMRTAAVTAAYIDAVAAPNVKTLAILGAGVQAKSHIDALRLVRGFDEIRIWNRTPERAEALADQVGDKARAYNEGTCRQAVDNADVVIATTASSEPVLEGAWLRPGAKVASVGWRGPNGGELDAATMANTVIVDSREGTLAESGNIRRYNAPIYAELGEVLAGTHPVPPEATVVFDSIGMACEDIAAAKLVYEKLAA